MTYNAQTDWKKIDWKKFKKFVKEDWKQRDWKWWLEKEKSTKCGRVEFQTPNGISKTWVWRIESDTLIYMLSAFLHGKLHMTKKRIPKGDASGGTEVVPFTKEMQEQAIGDLWKDFLIPETGTEVGTEPKSEKLAG